MAFCMGSQALASHGECLPEMMPGSRVVYLVNRSGAGDACRAGQDGVQDVGLWEHEAGVGVWLQRLCMVVPVGLRRVPRRLRCWLLSVPAARKRSKPTANGTH